MDLFRRAFRATAVDQKALVDYFGSFEAQLEALREANVIMTLKLVNDGRYFYLYYEAASEDYSPEDLFPGCADLIQSVPGHSGERKWVALMDVFHWHQPQSWAHWERQQPATQRLLMLARLKPEMVGSYIYYHQCQEIGLPGDDNKYVSIHLDEDYLLMYVELPKVIDKQPPNPNVDVSHVPRGAAWHALMNEHFAPIENMKEGSFWTELATILELG